ncbi:hypothetical protein DMH01_15515 [Amycolatopsis sp. WAC 04182]|nr:hypothetical protein DMH01_15515 [Amycolatopsis sp. WAC 04182]
MSAAGEWSPFTSPWRRQHSTEADLDNRERALAHQQDVAATTQTHQERVADAARADAAARRITELYTKAVEQLGSDKTPVRLGGLYALERLAQDNEDQRQTIVNVLCAYLRMPYELPEPPADDADADQLEQHRALVQEREVRLTAQRLLNDHLQPARGTAYRGPLDLDLARRDVAVLAGGHDRQSSPVALPRTRLLRVPRRRIGAADRLPPGRADQPRDAARCSRAPVHRAGLRGRRRRRWSGRTAGRVARAGARRGTALGAARAPTSATGLAVGRAGPPTARHTRSSAAPVSSWSLEIRCDTGV